jgi:predicted amidohydrolase YtcJ
MRLSCRIVPAAGSAPRPGTLSVEAGRIAGVDYAADARSDLVALPGLVDSHTHPLGAGLERLAVNLRGAKAIDEVIARVRTSEPLAREWGLMLGFNLEPDILAERRFPTRAELDRALPAQPLLLYRVDGHSAAVNSAGLHMLKQSGWRFEADTEQPLSGQAYETAAFLFRRRLSPAVIREALRRSGAAAAAAGVTLLGAMVGDADLELGEWQVLIDGLGAMQVRAVPWLQTWDTAVPRHFGLKRVGGCLLVDGSFGSHTAWLSSVYADAPAVAGRGYLSDDKLCAFVRSAREAGLATAFHAIGDKAVEQVVRCHEMLGPDATGHRIEHAELLSPGLIERIARLGLALVVQPAFEAEWGGPERMYRRRLGDRWRLTNPYRALLDAGVRLAGGSDWPITEIDPLAGMRAAVNHPNPEQRVTPDEALALFTVDAARVSGLESTGRLETGLDADVTLLTADPRSNPGARVVATCVLGKWVHVGDRAAFEQAVDDA